MTEETASKQQGQRPAIEFKGTGGVKVAVWKHKNENGPDGYTAVISRTFRDSDGAFQTVPYLRDSDLLRSQKLLEQADAWIEQEKNRQRGTSAGAGPQR